MSILITLKEYLDSSINKRIHITRSTRHNTDRLTRHVNCSCPDLTRSIIVNIDDGYLMVVLPASHRINLDLLKEVMSREGRCVEDERELRELFPDYETEIVSSSSKFKYFPVYVYFASPLSDDKEIVVNAGNFTDVMM